MYGDVSGVEVISGRYIVDRDSLTEHGWLISPIIVRVCCCVTTSLNSFYGFVSILSSGLVCTTSVHYIVPWDTIFRTLILGPWQSPRALPYS